MTIAEITELIGLCVSIISLVATIVVSVKKGSMRDFIIKKMEEAEASGKSGKDKLAFVVAEVAEKYRIMKVFMDTRAFVEKIIDATKKINSK